MAIERETERDPQLIINDLAIADVWGVFTLKMEDDKAHITVRESGRVGMATIVAMLLENEDFYKDVQEVITKVNLKTNGKSKPNVN